MKKVKNSGFTLIELIVVIGIIAILAAIVLMFLFTAKNKGEDSKRIGALKEIQNALHLFNTDNGYYPATADFPSALVNAKLIGAVDTSQIIYRALLPDDSECRTSGLTSCTSYHLATALRGTDNAVLNNDKDTSSPTGNPIYGNSTSCLAVGGSDMCYDIEP